MTVEGRAQKVLAPAEENQCSRRCRSGIAILSGRWMMNELIRKGGLRMVRQHPRDVLRISLSAGRHWKGVARTIETTRRASRLTGTVKQTVANPKVQAEAKLAVSDFLRAAQRARKVGLAKALEDKQLVDQLQQASSHASKAVAVASSQRRRHFIPGATLITVGGGLLGGAVYVGWRTYLRPTAS
jgi:hypothetical protein